MSRSLLIIACALITAHSFAAPIPKDAARADYFPLAKGNRWEFKTVGEASSFAIEVTESELKNGRTISTLSYQFEGTNHTERMAVDGAGLYRPGDGGTFDKPIVVLKYPLAIGASWDSKLPLGGAGPEAKATVKGNVDVKVPAGTYKSMEVRFVSGEGDQQNILTAWYAPGVGVVKQETVIGGTTTTIELSEFKPGK